MEKILKFLKENEYENLYIIRGILNNINGFKVEVNYDSLGEVNGLIALWQEEKAVTIRGNEFYTKNHIERLRCQNYSFYDMEYDKMSRIIKDLRDMNKSSLSYYFIMAYEAKTVKEVYDRAIRCKKISKSEWIQVAKIFKEAYNKEFTEFNPDNMEWLCMNYEEQTIGTICLEKVYEGFFILSNFYIVPDLRNKGLGTQLLKSVFNSYQNSKFILFVDIENTRAISLYEKMGFVLKSKLMSIE